mmetsp:Transcript_10447/g.13116  ORF Transcript_10447/g.13116 Transcript_10447/m.13116 type:complete len:105 (-) Transcript_10447:208-522(-)
MNKYYYNSILFASTCSIPINRIGFLPSKRLFHFSFSLLGGARPGGAPCLNWKQKRQLAIEEAKINEAEIAAGKTFEQQLASLSPKEQWEAHRKKVKWDMLFHSK